MSDSEKPPYNEATKLKMNESDVANYNLKENGIKGPSDIPRKKSGGGR